LMNLLKETLPLCVELIEDNDPPCPLRRAALPML
jgi:hypothetical protein